MDRETALENFLRSFKVALNNASTYFNEHPLFLKSVQDFKEKIKDILVFINPFIIGIAPHGLMIEGTLHELSKGVIYERVKLYAQLGQFLHIRKIQSIQMMADASVDELVRFLGALVLSPKDILKSGGMTEILQRENVTHCLVVELDYSHFLRGEGSEYKDIWTYLLRDAVEKKNTAVIGEFIANFKAIVDKVRTKDYLEDDAFRESINGFLGYLKNENPESFRKCSKDMMRAIIRDKTISQETKLDMLQGTFKDFSAADSAEALLDEIVANENFDVLNLRIFTQLIEKDMHGDVVTILARNLHAKSKENPRIVKKIQEILHVSTRTDLPEVYRSAFSSFSHYTVTEERSIDKEVLRVHYRFTLLNLLSQEQDKQKLGYILGKLIDEWEYIARTGDIQYLKNVVLTLERKQREIEDQSAFDSINRHIAQFTETLVLGHETSSDFDYFVNALKEPSHDIHFYLEKVFVEKKVNPYIFVLIFRFYPQHLSLLHKNIKDQYFNTSFLKKLIDCLKVVNTPASVALLQFIYTLVSNFLKVEVLRALQSQSNIDSVFLFSLLGEQDYIIKKEAFAILARHEVTRYKAIEALLSIPSPFGLKNSEIIGNIEIVQDYASSDAKKWLLMLCKRKYLWNRSLRAMAQKVLGGHCD